MRNFLIVLFTATLIGCSEPAPDTSGTAISNVTVIDAVNGIRENQSVVFDGDEIVAIQPADAALDVAVVIDGRGKFLIPGLWDFHVHLTYDDRFNDSMSALFLSYGVTSVRDTGGLMHKILPVVEKMRAEDALAPRVYFAGPLLDGNFVVYDGDSRPEIGTQNATPEQAKATIAELKSQGVDFIKIYEMVSPAVFDAMVEAANEHELPIDSHVPLSMRAGTAGPQVDSIEHLRNIELDCAANAPELHETRLELLKNEGGVSGFELRSSLHSLQRNPAIANYDEARCDETIAALNATMMVPTLRLNSFDQAPPYARDDWEEALSRIPEAVREDWAETGIRMAPGTNEPPSPSSEFSVFLVDRMHAAGVPIGAGTDTPIFLSIPGYSLHSELEMLVKSGLTPLEALESATVRPAEFFSIQDRIGTIDAGKQADLLLLDANPLDDIRNTKQIAAVVTKGRLMNRDDLQVLIRSSQQAPPGNQ
ncbi:MAG: amidohydrolase family protein [Woeseiaceae bacterium]